LEALQQNTWVHLTCHGEQDPEQPYHLHFVMRDERLTLFDIMERHSARQVRILIHWSHCRWSGRDANEVIHLAAGLQFSGFKGVVGTLWEVDDSVASHIFYQYMFKASKRALS
ncbi:hypothetical protein BDR04DRAFT_1035092, partial [Suillus decipiens]